MAKRRWFSFREKVGGRAREEGEKAREQNRPRYNTAPEAQRGYDAKLDKPREKRK